MLYALISPAQRLDFKPQPGIKTTQPALLKDTAILAARAIVENRWETPEQMKAFDTAGYAYDEKRSTETMMVFSRTAPQAGVTARF